MNDDEHCSTDPRWRRGNLNFETLIFGSSVHSKENVRTVMAVVPMPEGAYPAKVELHDAVWTDRFRRRVIPRAEVSVEDVIPHQGKGESSWDCGEDACFGLTTKAETVEEAIGAMVESVLGSRRRYDGKLLAVYPEPRIRRQALAERRAAQAQNPDPAAAS